MWSLDSERESIVIKNYRDVIIWFVIVNMNFVINAEEVIDTKIVNVLFLTGINFHNLENNICIFLYNSFIFHLKNV